MILLLSGVGYCRSRTDGPEALPVSGLGGVLDVRAPGLTVQSSSMHNSCSHTPNAYRPLVNPNPVMEATI